MMKERKRSTPKRNDYQEERYLDNGNNDYDLPSKQYETQEESYSDDGKSILEQYQKAIDSSARKYQRVGEKKGDDDKWEDILPDEARGAVGGVPLESLLQTTEEKIEPHDKKKKQKHPSRKNPPRNVKQISKWKD